MKKTLTISNKTRTFLFIIAGVIVAGFLLVSCGGGGYGGGGGMYGGTSMVTPPAKFMLVSPINGTSVTSPATLTWNTATGATGYYVYLTGGTFNNMLIATVMQPMTPTVTTMTPALAAATSYIWQVNAYSMSPSQTPASNGPGSFVTP